MILNLNGAFPDPLDRIRELRFLEPADRKRRV